MEESYGRGLLSALGPDGRLRCRAVLHGYAQKQSTLPEQVKQTTIAVLQRKASVGSSAQLKVERLAVLRAVGPATALIAVFVNGARVTGMAGLTLVSTDLVATGVAKTKARTASGCQKGLHSYEELRTDLLVDSRQSVVHSSCKPLGSKGASPNSDNAIGKGRSFITSGSLLTTGAATVRLPHPPTVLLGTRLTLGSSP